MLKVRFLGGGSLTALVAVTALLAVTWSSSTGLARAEDPGTGPDAARAQRVVDRWLRSASLRGVKVGVAVAQLPSGDMLATADPDTLYNPASGAKLLTTASALAVLPLDTTWTTTLCGHVDAGVVRGPLIVHGGGDPKLLPADIERLARELADAGVGSIPGGIVVDASRFDAHTLPPAYEQKSPDSGYRPSIGAAGSNFGAVRVTVRPGKRVGARVALEVESRCDGLTVKNTAKTVAGADDGLIVRAEAVEGGRTAISVSGTLGVEAETWWERRRLDNPDAFTGYLLRHHLRRAGVEVGGEVTVRRGRGAGPPPPELARHHGAALPQTIDDINTWSNNFMAEMLLKQLGVPADGGPATWERGVRVATDALTGLGLPSESFRVVNGSGLYVATHISPRAMTTLLAAMAADAIRGPPFDASLAVAGKPGTLSSRLKGKLTAGKVRGKTGTLDEVVSLSGYVPSKHLGTLAFAVFINDATPDRTATLRAAIDRLVVKLARL